MGQFSWFTQDTHRRIVNGQEARIVMTDDKGNEYVEDCYEGYGVFGGKDFYELVAEMNGVKVVYENGEYLICLGGEVRERFGRCTDIPEAKRQLGISLAFKNNGIGDNPYINYPSLTENGVYQGGSCPESDPDQGFPDCDDDYDW